MEKVTASSPFSHLEGLIDSQRGQLDSEFVGQFERAKDRLFSLQDQELAATATYLGLPPNATNKDVINAFTCAVFPEMGRRTLAEHGEYLRSLEGRVLDHFASYGVPAATTGSYALGGARTQFSDYDVLISPPHNTAKWGDYLHAVNDLPSIGIVGFGGYENGALGGAEMVLGHGNEGFGFVRAMTLEGTTVELFILGAQSLQHHHVDGYRIRKVQPPTRRWMRVRGLADPHDEHIINEPGPLGEYDPWPRVTLSDGRESDAMGFFGTLVTMAVPARHDINKPIIEARQSVIAETRRRLHAHNAFSTPSQEIQSWFRVMGAGNHFTPQRQLEFAREYLQV